MLKLRFSIVKLLPYTYSAKSFIATVQNSNKPNQSWLTLRVNEGRCTWFIFKALPYTRTQTDRTYIWRIKSNVHVSVKTSPPVCCIIRQTVMFHNAMQSNDKHTDKLSSVWATD